MRTGFAAALAFGLALGASLPAQAQMFNQVGKSGKPQQPSASVAPPPALPGAGSSSAPAPLTRVPTDMEPNEALFDSINRGDIATARDAISRGADLHARSILGMTPLELSIDLGRNDISFMLLSMRAADDSRSAQSQRASGVKDDAKRPMRQAKKAAPPRPVAPSPAAQQTARLFSGDGGTPNPNAGFLGFDSGRR
jgi:hypothetical protein